MNNLYGKQRKLLKILYKKRNQKITITKTELSKLLNLSYTEVGQLCKELHDNGFIDYIGLDYNPKLSPKGQDYFSFESGEWLSHNLIAILALVVSIFAFIRTL